MTQAEEQQRQQKWRRGVEMVFDDRAARALSLYLGTYVNTHPTPLDYNGAALCVPKVYFMLVRVHVLLV